MRTCMVFVVESTGIAAAWTSVLVAVIVVMCGRAIVDPAWSVILRPAAWAEAGVRCFSPALICECLHGIDAL